MHQAKRTWSLYDHLPSNAFEYLKSFLFKLGFSQEFGTLFRYEFDMALLRLWCAVSPGYHRHVKRLRRRHGLKVHLGCGNTLKADWINVDCYPPPRQPDCEILTCDIRQGLPFATNSVTAIYSEHFIEHIPFGIVRRTLLPECFRILEPGGHIRVGVPDGEWWIRQYQFKRGIDECPIANGSGGRLTWMMDINRVTREASRSYLYDYETLEVIFSDAGFTGLRKSRANDSDVPDFQKIDQADEWRVSTTVYIEGYRPE